MDSCVQDRKDKAATKIEGRALLALLFPSLPAAWLTYTGRRGGGGGAGNKVDDTNNKGESSSGKVFGSLPAAGLTRGAGGGAGRDAHP